MPQVIPEEHGKHQRGVLYVPIEMLNGPDGYACPALGRLHGSHLAELENNKAVMKQHYVKQVAGNSSESSRLPWPILKVAKAQQRLPSYDSFWSNHSFCRRVVGCLYQSDVEKYIEACTSPELLGCRAFNAACDEQLGRLRDVCGIKMA